jgi:peptidoglycan/xylan/chitin deacetylase (PgdA/CDA1 family)
MRKITLTFDNGPDAATTAGVLDCLDRHSLRSTFFVLGSRAETTRGRELVLRASAAGHWIGNHTYSHSTPLGELDEPRALDELERTHGILQSLGVQERLFRPFGRAGSIGTHLLNPAVVEWLKTHRYSCVLWNSVPGDWCDPDNWPAVAIAQCMALDWSLVVLHDLPTGAMRLLESFIVDLQSRGFEFTQEFPSECTPIVQGRIVRSLAGFVSSPTLAVDTG